MGPINPRGSQEIRTKKKIETYAVLPSSLRFSTRTNFLLVVLRYICSDEKRKGCGSNSFTDYDFVPVSVRSG